MLVSPLQEHAASARRRIHLIHSAIAPPGCRATCAANHPWTRPDRGCCACVPQAAWETGALASVGLSRAEVVRFIKAVFSDSQLRTDCIARVMALAHHEHSTAARGEGGAGGGGARSDDDSADEEGPARRDGGGGGGGGGMRMGGGGLTSFLLRQGGALGMIAPAPAAAGGSGGGGGGSGSAPAV